MYKILFTPISRFVPPTLPVKGYKTPSQTVDTLVGMKALIRKKEIKINQYWNDFLQFEDGKQFLYARRRQDVLWDHPWRAASTSLSVAYLQNYSSYGYEISLVDRSHQGGVQCAGIITLASLNFQLLPFVFYSYLNFVRSISPKLY